MARPLKTGIDYFPLDVDFFVDDKIIAIVGEFGIKGEAAVIHLLCAIYRNGYFAEWGERLKSKLDRELPGVSVKLLDEIIDRLVRWGFFDKDLFHSSSILTSRGIQRRYFEATRKRKGDFSELPYLLIAPPHSKQAPVPRAEQPSPTTYARNAAAEIPSVISGAEMNETCRSRFFSTDNRAGIEMLMVNLSLSPNDYTRLLEMTSCIINEWNLTGTTHKDYADWSRHLISLLRIKINDKRKQNGSGTTTFRQKERDATLAGYKQAFDFFEERQRQEDPQRNGGEL